jgi:quinol-cytochrome oxidoreductase complex cytochrome b subunit
MANSKTEEHLNLLSVFQFIYTGLMGLGIVFIFFHYKMMSMIMMNKELWEQSENTAPFDPEIFFEIFMWFYIVFGILLVIGMILNFLSGMYMRQKRNRLFSLVIGGINCVNVPLGTVLGVFTIIILNNEETKEMYSTEYRVE